MDTKPDITKTLYFQGKELNLAKDKLCREIWKSYFKPLLAFLDRWLVQSTDTRTEN